MTNLVACKPDVAGGGQPAQSVLPAPTKAPTDAPPAGSTMPSEAPLVTVVPLHYGPSPDSQAQVLLAVGFNIAKDWHIYWENPGDSGLATEVDFALPDGFTVSPGAYPAPQRIVSSSGQTSYGYEHHAALFFTVSGPFHRASATDTSAPGTSAPGTSAPVKIDATAEFLVCRESCQRGKQAISWRIDGATPAPPLAKPWLALQQRLPRDDTASATPTALRPHSMTLKNDLVELAIRGAANERIEEFFPLLSEPYRLIASELHEGNLSLRYRQVEGPAEAKWWQSSRPLGVAQLRTATGERTFATVRSAGDKRH